MFKNILELIRNFSLELDFPIAKIKQNKNNGFELRGHGTIKTNSFGIMILNFICLDLPGTLPLGTKIPEDLFNDDDYFSFVGTTLDGNEISSDNLILKTPVFRNEIAQKFNIAINSFKIIDNTRRVAGNEQNIYLEFNGKLGLPKNKSTKITSDNGSYSISRDKAVFSDESIKVECHERTDYCEIFVQGLGNCSEESVGKIIFPFNFISGQKIRPYYFTYPENGQTVHVFQSVSRQSVSKSILPPTVENIEPKYYDLVYSLWTRLYNWSLTLDDTYAYAFESWRRIWHSFQCNSDKVAALVLTTAIEGLVNTFYKSNLTKTDNEFQELKDRLSSHLENLTSEVPGISMGHINSLKKEIARWGNQNINTLLQRLCELELVEKDEFESWKALRNKLAHPTTSTINALESRKDHKRLLDCLGLYYKLMLNYLGYQGPALNYSNLKGNLILFEPVIVTV